MTTIIDASVALKWVCEEEGSDRAAELLDGRPLAAPSFWLVEAANALWRRVQRGELDLAEAEERIAELSCAPVDALDAQEMTPAALKLGCELKHPVYDCLYLEAAIRTGGRVVTADRRFHQAASGHAYFGAMVALL
jgi:predicted nucleic acid-binding protein